MAVKMRADLIDVGDLIDWEGHSVHPVRDVIVSQSGKYVYLVGPPESSVFVDGKVEERFACRDLRVGQLVDVFED